jgi:tetraacyldisaccharide 4'-kinase
VHLDEPRWWYVPAPDVRARLLAPLGRLYGWIGERRFRRRQAYRSRFPVICVGNFTAGGTGKTPLAIFIAELLKARGQSPVFLTRGYGGSVHGPAWVDGEGSAAAHRFGDEPLLLARVAPTLVARDRKAGILMLETSGRKVSAVIMDDGLQNPALAKDFAIAVVDGARGLGNGEVIPAGPLRAAMEFQLGLVDAIVVREPLEKADGEPQGVHGLLKRGFPGPVLEAHTEPTGDTAWVAERPVVAFAGIANPQRFYALLESLGARLIERVTFPDHHFLSRKEAERLLHLAAEGSAQLVTTEKDWVRLKGGAYVPEALVQATRPLPITLTFEPRHLERLASLIEAATQQQGFRRVRPPQL